MGETLLSATGLKKYFPITKGLLLMRLCGWLRAVDGVSFYINSGETLALVGESGCGKTTTAKLILFLERPTAGSVCFQGREILGLKRRDLTHYRACVQAVFQNPYASLDPRTRVGRAVAEPLIIHKTVPKGLIADRAREVLRQVGLSPDVAALYPHELSGGQRQRVSIARALVLNPKLIVLDEPVSALDVSIRGQIMNLLKDLQAQTNTAYFLIAHDLSTVRFMSDRIAVMYLGKIVELASSRELFSSPLHPYTKALLSAALPSHPDDARQEIVLAGEVPSIIDMPTGCRFHPRCYARMPLCSEEDCQLKEAAAGHSVACHRH